MTRIDERRMWAGLGIFGIVLILSIFFSSTPPGSEQAAMKPSTPRSAVFFNLSSKAKLADMFEPVRTSELDSFIAQLKAMLHRD